jgi:hypothetical protein
VGNAAERWDSVGDNGGKLMANEGAAIQKNNTVYFLSFRICAPLTY